MAEASTLSGEKIVLNETIQVFRKPSKAGCLSHEKEAVMMDDIVFVGRYHDDAFNKMCVDKFSVETKDYKTINDIYGRCLAGGDLAGKVYHGWWSEQYQTFTWNYCYGV